MNEEQNGQQVLIDTQAERNQLDYRPNPEYKKTPRYEVNVGNEVEGLIPEGGSLDEIGPITDVGKQYELFGDLLETLNGQLEWLDDELKEAQIPVSPIKMERISTTSPDIAGQITDGYISFALYRETFLDPESPGNALIQDIVSEYAEDVEGDYRLEAYEDFQELYAGLNEGYFLYKELVLKSYLNADIPEEPSLAEEDVRRIDEAVLRERENFAAIKKEAEQEEVWYYESLRTEYGTPEFFNRAALFEKKKRPHELSLRKEKTTKEMISLVGRMLAGTARVTSRLKSELVIGGELEEKEVMKVLEDQVSSIEEKRNLLSLSQLSLKLQVNQQIQEKRQYRDVLKNINSLSRKKRAHDELIMANTLRNKLYLTLYDTLQHLESPSKKEDVEIFLNNLAGGMELVQREYETFLRDVALIYRSGYEVRSEKVQKMSEKEYARTGYTLVSKHLEQ